MKDAGGHGSNSRGGLAPQYAKRGFTDGSKRPDIGWHLPVGIGSGAHSTGIQTLIARVSNMIKGTQK